jgi:hypothetical protein
VAYVKGEMNEIKKLIHVFKVKTSNDAIIALQEEEARLKAE